MDCKPTKIDGVMIAETNVHQDARGGLMRMFCKNDLKWPHDIAQANYSFSQGKGTVRGMHFQRSPALEAKIVRCIKGAILDVAVDLRKDSPTFLQHVAVELSAENNLALMIPEGCAHGFQTLADDCAMVYLHSAAYAPEHEGGVRFDDPQLAINWPLQPANMSERDQSFALIDENFVGIEV